MSSFERDLNNKLAGMLKSPPASHHRCRRTNAVQGRTAWGGVEYAACRCRRIFRRLPSGRWTPLSADELTALDALIEKERQPEWEADQKYGPAVRPLKTHGAGASS